MSTSRDLVRRLRACAATLGFMLLNGVVHALTPLGGVSAISTGNSHACALTSGGAVKCWGWNFFGQVGDGTNIDRYTAVSVSGLSGGVTAISVGNGSACALTSSGGVKCWGFNANGGLGDGTLIDRWTPVNVSGLSSGVTAISGSFHTCALTSSGGVKCWGVNDHGQLGDGTVTNRWTPVNVSGLSSGVTAIAAGWWHTCALTSSGAVKCWGRNGYRQLGDGTNIDRWTPVAVSGLSSGVIKIAAGAYHTCALTSGGGVKCWGGNGSGELGIGTTSAYEATPVAVSGLSSGVAGVAAGYWYTCALTSGGGVKCWGFDLDGQLGDGTNANPDIRATPADVIGLASGATAVAAGRDLTCAVTSGGGAKCWGSNVAGQLGDPTVVSARPYPGDVLIDLGALSPVPVISSVSPTSMAADGMSHKLTINGSNFSSGNQVQFSFTGSGGWANSLSTPTISSGQVIISMYSGTTTDTIYVRVCRSASQTTASDCSAQNAQVSVTAVSPPPEQTPPSPVEVLEDSSIAPTAAHNAVVITHGTGVDASGWVREMALYFCLNIGDGVGQIRVAPPDADKWTKICQRIVPGKNTLWDVWVMDWRSEADEFFPWNAYSNAKTVGEGLATQLKDKGYKNIHLIGHSAGANLIDSATIRLKKDPANANVHATFLDAYEPGAIWHPTWIGRHTSQYGKDADWVDNYVDTRPVILEGVDTTDLHLDNGFNFNVTPTYNGCEDNYTFSSICNHSRPWRFYGLSVDSEFVGDTGYMQSDPISSVSWGFNLSLENGITLATLQSGYPEGGECKVGEVCYSLGSPPSVWSYLPGAIGETVVDGVAGAVDFVTGTSATLFNSLKLGVNSLVASLGTKSSGVASAKGGVVKAGDITPIDTPSWVAVLVTTTEPVSTLRFNWRFAAQGQGFLRVYVGNDLVRELDQRHVPLASLTVEEVYVGGEAGSLPPGTYRIVFRLDGFATSPSGVVLTNVELVQKQVALVAPSTSLMGVSVVGSGTVISNPAGILCESDCSENYAIGTSVRLTATPYPGSIFAGWLGACVGTGTCTASMFAAKSVTAAFTSTGAGSANSNLWVQRAYVAYYGRPADPGGLAYWAARMDQEGGSLSSIIASFGYSDEFNRRYGGLTYSELIDILYQQTLGRAPDQSGKDWYLSQLNAGKTTLQTITLDLLGGATGEDALTVANRLDVANHFTGKVAAGCAYGGEQTGVSSLATVTPDFATVLGAKSTIENRCGP